MSLRLYSTLSGTKEEFVPINPPRVNFFVCGPTVYDAMHLGHARTYIAFDVIVKYLRASGYKVFYLQNITDLDDKIIARAAEAGEAPQKLAATFKAAYFKNLADLHIDSLSATADASAYIPEIIQQITALIKKDYAYSSNGSVYFRTKKFPGYGKLAHQNIDELKAGARVEVSAEKEDPLDFDLWKKAKPGEPQWESPWGPGRPGWHIEDTAITEKFFGPQYDIHGGALDLIFPHHECEIAQMEAASGKEPLARYWMHTGFLTIRGTKMSKSLHNFTTVNDILRKYPYEVLRMFTLGAHYRSPIDYDEKYLEQAQANTDTILTFRLMLRAAATYAIGHPGSAETDSFAALIAELRQSFAHAMDDDFNTPQAIAALMVFINNATTAFATAVPTPALIQAMETALNAIHAILGIMPDMPAIPEEITKLANRREAERARKDWAAADALRDQLKCQHWEILDTLFGPVLIPVHTSPLTKVH